MVYIGLMQMSTGGYRRAMDNCWSKGFDVVALPIKNSINCTQHGYDFDHVNVSNTEFNYRTILMLSRHWSMPDTALDRKRMQKEIDMCRYWQTHTCMLLRLAKEVNIVQASMFGKLKGMLIIEVPAFHPKLLSELFTKHNWDSLSVDRDAVLSHNDTWSWWYAFSKKLNFNAHLRLCLEVQPEIKPSSKAMKRWLAEPLEAVVFPRDFFNVKYSSESKVSVTPRFSRLKILIQLYQHGVNVLVHASPNDEDLEHIVKYLKILGNKYKLLPLHPLGMLANRLHVPSTEILSPWTKEIDKIFKDDSYKYTCYANALSFALRDFKKSNKRPNDLEHEYNVAVVAPPHAHIVSAVIEGAHSSKCFVCIYYVTIGTPKTRTTFTLSAELTLVECNVADGKFREQLPLIDIIVNEQFGIMEESGQMSPYSAAELLSCLNPSTGCCIPNSLSVFLRPVMSTRLYNSYRKLENELAKHKYHSTHSMPFPSRYVFSLSCSQFVYKVTYKYCSKEEAIYYRDLESATNTLRTFRVGNLDCVLNALRADYVVNLYKNIVLTTRRVNNLDPELNSLSTMAIFFMFEEPILLKRNEQIEFGFMRRSANRKCWYEWSISGHPTQNCGGCKCLVQHENKIF